MRPTKSSHCFQVKGKQVKFSSTFDSGNLRTVTQIGEFQFLVQSSYDTYQIPASSKSFFHFKVENFPLNERIKIVIKNLNLLDCIKQERRIFYRPCFSLNGQDYQRLPQNSFIVKKCQGSSILQIDYLMQKSSVYFSFALPYSYERYLNMVRDLPEPNQQFYIKKEVLCYTKNLHLVYMITITSYDRRTNQYDQIGSSTNGVILPQKHLNQSRIYFDKPVLLISARVHPGQTPSSWAIQGIIKFLVQNSQEAKILRKNFLIVIVPMLNPDGVQQGLYRLDTQCHNLNRYYLVSDNRQPSIYSMKHLINHYYASKRLLFYFDFHGHPSFKGSFLYGNAIDDIAYQAETELFGRIMSMYCDTFQQKYCIFDRQQMSSKDKYDMYTKQGCARVYAFKTANILHSYTVEMGFHGCTNFPQNSSKSKQQFYYTQADYYNQGVSVLMSVLQACSLIKPNGIDKNKIRKEIAEQILIRQQRFRKQDKYISIKKKNVNQTLQKQYWNPVKKRFFNSSNIKLESPKTKKTQKKKVISRTSFISSSFIRNQQNRQYNTLFQKHLKLISESRERLKLQTQSFQLNQQQSLVQKKYIDNKRKKLEMRHRIFSSSNKSKDVSLLSNKHKQDSNQTAKKIQFDKRIVIDKTIEKSRKNSIKINSGRKESERQLSKAKKALQHQNFQQFTFNDQNMRKYDGNQQNQCKNSFCFISADKFSPRIEEIREIFRPEFSKNIQNPRKLGKTFKKYSILFN